MIQRIIPIVIGITFLISGCAKQQDHQEINSFSMGATILKIAHLPSPTADGSGLFITVDGKEAGLLPVGKAMLLHVPAGEHRVGGYARSLIGSVTIPGLTVITSPDKPRFVTYRVAQYDPLFMERGIDPLPLSAPIPEKQVGQSESVPVPEIIQLSLPESSADVMQPVLPEELTRTPSVGGLSVDSDAVVTPVEPDLSATGILSPQVNTDSLWLSTEVPITETLKKIETK